MGSVHAEMRSWTETGRASRESGRGSCGGGDATRGFGAAPLPSYGMLKHCGTNDWVWFGFWLAFSFGDVFVVNKALTLAVPSVFAA